MDRRHRQGLCFGKMDGKFLASVSFCLPRLELSFIDARRDRACGNASKGEQALACFAGGSQNNRRSKAHSSRAEAVSRSASMFRIAAAVSSIERRVTSMIGQPCREQTLRI